VRRKGITTREGEFGDEDRVTRTDPDNSTYISQSFHSTLHREEI
jgi:hypothetical protein